MAGDPHDPGQGRAGLGENAARHAHTRIRLTLTQAGGRVVLGAEDDGPRIPRGDREQIFERFVRLNAARDSDRGGSGLGLAIVAELVYAHGGTGTACGSSTLDGARIQLDLRAANTDAAENPPPLAAFGTARNRLSAYGMTARWHPPVTFAPCLELGLALGDDPPAAGLSGNVQNAPRTRQRPRTRRAAAAARRRERLKLRIASVGLIADAPPTVSPWPTFTVNACGAPWLRHGAVQDPPRGLLRGIYRRSAHTARRQPLTGSPVGVTDSQTPPNSLTLLQVTWSLPSFV